MGVKETEGGRTGLKGDEEEEDEEEGEKDWWAQGWNKERKKEKKEERKKEERSQSELKEISAIKCFSVCETPSVTGEPQGSVTGPLLFLIYVKVFSQTARVKYSSVNIQQLKLYNRLILRCKMLITCLP